MIDRRNFVAGLSSSVSLFGSQQARADETCVPPWRPVGSQKLSDRGQLSQAKVPQSVVVKTQFFVRDATYSKIVSGFPAQINHVDAPCAFTFDDGPYDGISQPLLEWLVNEQISATFFLIGSRAERMPLFVKELDAAGMIIGSHGYGPDPNDHGIWATHDCYGSLSAKAIKDDITRGHNTLSDILGKSPKLFRAPFNDVPGTNSASDPKCILDEPTQKQQRQTFWDTINELGYDFVCGYYDPMEEQKPLSGDDLWRQILANTGTENPNDASLTRG